MGCRNRCPSIFQADEPLRRLRRPPGGGTGYCWGSVCSQISERICQGNRTIREQQTWGLPWAGSSGRRLLPSPCSGPSWFISNLHSRSPACTAPLGFSCASIQAIVSFKLRSRPFHAPVRTCVMFCLTPQTNWPPVTLSPSTRTVITPARTFALAHLSSRNILLEL